MNKYLNYYFILINLIGLLFMYIDKRRAKLGKWRIKEKTLFMIAIIGGSIGSLIGMKLFRHKTKHKKFKYGIPIIILIQLIIFLYCSNNYISVANYSIKSNTIPSEFDGFKIVQISDLHNKVFPFNNFFLTNIIKNEKPNAIFITGDIIDKSKYDEDKALLLINQIKSISPIYYVTGNHEAWSTKFQYLEKKLEDNGVIILHNSSVILSKGDSKISICGIDDPAFNNSYNDDYNIAKKEIDTLRSDDYYSILLSHRPELFDLYVSENFDLVFTGHAHGGQVILPFIGGLVSPNQSILPKYYKGIYSDKETYMIVSRGLGNSIIPLRIFNPPEIVVTILQK